MEQKTIGKSKEDYLKAILIVLKEHGACRNVDVSVRLGVSKSSTCIAIKKLEQDGLVEKDEWRILLTKKGRILAENLYEKDLFFSSLFKQIGVSEKVAERDACMIEHVISEETYCKLKNYIAIDRLTGVITPSTSALLHNGSTIMTGVKSTTRLIETKGN